MDKIQPPKNLRKNILLGIVKTEVRRAKIYLAITLTVLPISLVGAFWTGQYLVRSFYESGFYEYLSLLSSGDGIVLAYWKELLYSLAETVPIVNMIAFLITIAFLIWSGANAITNMRRFSIAN